MIRITYVEGDRQGACVYKIKVDEQVICCFEHHNADGLTKCLRRAADAAELSEWADMVLLDDIKGG